MSNNPILAPAIAAMLTDLAVMFSKFDIDFYLVGAVARDIHLSAKYQWSSPRSTKDVDLAITISDELQQRIIAILSKRETARWQAMLEGMRDVCVK